MSESPSVYQMVIESPVGPIELVSNGESLNGLYFSSHKNRPEIQSNTPQPCSLLREAAHQLEAYFAGRRQAFDVPLAVRGTEFQRTVWGALKAIPFGESISYAELARRMERPSACRAVGTANGRNPISIIIPCHRVVGMSGRLTGYAGGLKIKEWLITHERGGLETSQS